MLRFNLKLSLIILGCLVLYAGWTPIQGQTSVEADARALAIEAIKHSHELLDQELADCKLSGQTLRYIGSTNELLKNCLAAHPTAATLKITSWGGDVILAIEAAETLAARRMDVQVLGICFSSCGNYIVPVAQRLTVLPYSVIALHGAPAPNDIPAIRLELFDALKAAGLTDEQITDELIASQIPNITRARDMHEVFQQHHSVGEAWYAFDFLDLEPETMVIVSKSHLLRCVPLADVDYFWHPEKAGDFEELRAHLSGNLVFLDYELKAPEKC